MNTAIPFRWPDQQENNLAHERLVAFLVTDIQHSPNWTCEILTKIEAIQAGQVPQWERVGNAFRLELLNDDVLIEDLVDESQPGYKIPLEEFKIAVSAWLDWITTG